MMEGGPNLTLVDLDDGGLLMNLRTGVVFQLNLSAAFVWRRLLAGDARTEIARALVSRYGLDESVAERDVATAEEMDLATPASYPRLDSEFHYERDATGFVFSFLGKAVLRLDTRGEEITAVSGGPPPDLLERLLMALVPKIAALRGGTVLHAAAILGRSGEVTAISGESGSGKTTTARAASAAGARLVSEDKLVLASGERVDHVMLDGEARLHEWVARAAREIAPNGRASCNAIDRAFHDGPAARLSSILLIDARRRSPSLRADRLSQTAAAAAIFHASFFGSDVDGDWRASLARSATLGATVTAFEATMPDGLPFSRQAAQTLADGTFRSG
jgi:hypothetical protein